MAKIGLQLWSVNKEIENEGLEAVVRKCKKIGYNNFELCGEQFLNDNLDVILKLRDELNVGFEALHFGIELDENNEPINEIEKLVENCRKVGIKFLSVAMMPRKFLKNEGTYLEYAKVLQNFSMITAKHDIKLYYHNHHLEFVKFEQECGIDILFNNTYTVGFELDVHWIQKGGKNPIEYINKFKDRCELVHLKDYIVYYDDKNGTFTDEIRFAEIGEGNLDISQIIDTAILSGTQIFYVEQDDMYGKDAYETIAISLKNLIKLGYEDLL